MIDFQMPISPLTFSPPLTAFFAGAVQLHASAMPLLDVAAAGRRRFRHFIAFAAITMSMPLCLLSRCLFFVYAASGRQRDADSAWPPMPIFEIFRPCAFAASAAMLAIAAPPFVDSRMRTPIAGSQTPGRLRHWLTSRNILAASQIASRRCYFHGRVTSRLQPH
jgi:hypothetical protein